MGVKISNICGSVVFTDGLTGIITSITEKFLKNKF